MTKKAITLALVFNIISLLNSCHCATERYFDYKGIESSALLRSSSDERPILLITTTYKDTYHLAQSKPQFTFGTSAYAMSGCEKGYDGEKYLVEKISIKSNADIDDQHPAGTELRDLLKTYNHIDYNTTDLVYLSEIDFKRANKNFLYLDLTPTAAKHIFTVEFTKSNGEVLTAITPEINWKWELENFDTKKGQRN
ncbi:hypothetical protein L1275_001340 [Flavobacterium sp. HSC-61S13]|nr:hypothetical protein [Flavobacterium sp. HSC-61S13]